MTVNWYIACPMMFFIIVLDTRALFRPYGFLSRSSSVGCSVARASDAKVSMIRLTHNICTAFNGLSCDNNMIFVAPTQSEKEGSTLAQAWVKTQSERKDYFFPKTELTDHTLVLPVIRSKKMDPQR